MEQPIVIRKAKLSDIDILTELLKSLFTIETDFTIDEERQRKGLSIMLNEPNNCCIFVAEYERHIVGMCTCQLLVSTAEGGFKAVLEDLVVSAEKRSLGIGSRLVMAIEKWALSCGAKRIDLLADERNYPALTFYEKHNWQRTNLIALQRKI